MQGQQAAEPNPAEPNPAKPNPAELNPAEPNPAELHRQRLAFIAIPNARATMAQVPDNPPADAALKIGKDNGRSRRDGEAGRDIMARPG